MSKRISEMNLREIVERDKPFFDYFRNILTVGTWALASFSGALILNTTSQTSSWHYFVSWTAFWIAVLTSVYLFIRVVFTTWYLVDLIPSARYPKIVGLLQVILSAGVAISLLMITLAVFTVALEPAIERTAARKKALENQLGHSTPVTPATGKP